MLGSVNPYIVAGSSLIQKVNTFHYFPSYFMKAQSSRIVKDHHIIHRNAWSVNGRIQQEWHIEHLGFQKERRCHLNLNNIVNNNKYLSMISDFLLVVCSTYTPIPAMAYYINDLSIQLCVRGQPISKLGESFTKYVHHTMPIFEKKFIQQVL